MRKVFSVVAVLFFLMVLALPAVSAEDTEPGEQTDKFISYYGQLDVNGKAIYDALNNADPDTTEITVNLPIVLIARADAKEDAEEYIVKTVRSTINKAFIAMRLGSPLAFWAWTSTAINYDINTTSSGETVTAVSITFTAPFINSSVVPNKSEPQSMAKMLEDINTEMNKFHPKGNTIREKVLEINNYLTKLVVYDPNFGDNVKESRYSHDVYGVFADPKHYAVCDGYSKAFLLLCEREGIESVVVLGTALDTLGNHAWNYVKMDDGKWYAVDVTWNDNNKMGNPYFLLGADTFFQTHHQGVYLSVAEHSPYPFNAPTLSGKEYKKGIPIEDLYMWALAAAMVAIFSVVLYRYAIKGT